MTKTLQVYLPITGRQIMHLSWCDGKVTRHNIFSSFEAMIDKWMKQGVEFNLTSSIRDSFIYSTHELFLDYIAAELNELDFVTKITIT
jgi:hypothetical protein